MAATIALGLAMLLRPFFWVGECRLAHLCFNLFFFFSCLYACFLFLFILLSTIVPPGASFRATFLPLLSLAWFCLFFFFDANFFEVIFLGFGFLSLNMQVCFVFIVSHRNSFPVGLLRLLSPLWMFFLARFFLFHCLLFFCLIMLPYYLLHWDSILVVEPWIICSAYIVNIGLLVWMSCYFESTGSMIRVF